ncbi:phosphorylated ctd-interacting factor 1 [Nannochloropsis oceanica]
MDALLDEMYKTQVGGMPREGTDEVATATAAAAAVSSKDSDDDDDDDDNDAQTSLPSPTSPSSSSIWRPDIKPPKDALRHAKARCQGYIRPSPELNLEILRHNAVGNLTCFFLNKVNRGLEMDLRIPPFERWLFSQHRIDGSDDPILPDPRLGDEHAKAGRTLLRRELVDGGVSKSSAEKVMSDLNKTAVKLLGQVQRASAMMGSVSSDLKGRQPLIRVRFDAGRGLYQLQHKATTVTVNQAHYDKLQALHARFGREEQQQQQQQQQQAKCNDVKGQEKNRFHHRLFLLLLRYSSLAGGTERGGGFQGAINEEAFDVLLRLFDCRMECFASPLNCRYPRYCSAFEDTDGYFGSLGSFFSFFPKEGVYEANPPFLPCVIERMAQHMEELLQASERPLGFVVVIPAWKPEEVQAGEAGKEGGKEEGKEEGKEHPAAVQGKAISIAIAPHYHNNHKNHQSSRMKKGKKRPKSIYTASGSSWRRLRESPFCVRHVLLRAQSHGYVEGSQHKLPTRFKTSYFDTSVFVLQNGAGREAWPVTEEAVRELEWACKSKHEAETAARRGEGGRRMEEGGKGGENEEKVEFEVEKSEAKEQEQPIAHGPQGVVTRGKEQDGEALQRKKRRRREEEEERGKETGI